MTRWRTRRRPALQCSTAFLGLAVLMVVACSGETESHETLRSPMPQPTATLPRPSVSPTSSSPLEASDFCTANDLEASAFYRRANAMTMGGFMATNISSAPCVVQGRPDLSLLDGDGDILAVVDRGNTIDSQAEAVWLRPGEVAAARFVWIWRCPLDVRLTPVPGGIVFLVNLPQGGGQLTFIATNPISGEPQGHDLPCGAPGQIPFISVGAFERAGN